MSAHYGSPSELTPGGWHYRLEHLAGEGASSQVWRALHEPSGVPVALKIGRSEAERARLLSEAERLAAVGSPGLGAVLDVGRVPGELPGHPELAGCPFVALQWLPGQALTTLAVLGADRVQVALTVARDVGGALADLHAAGLAHGDVKPANILLDPAEPPRAHLIDLGLGDFLASELPAGATPAYLAPEALLPAGGGNARSRDLWALGLSLARTLDPDAAVGPRLHEQLAHAPEGLRTLILALLSPSPAARPAAGWVAATARSLLGQHTSAAERDLRGRRAIRQSYLLTRWRELHEAARSSPPLIHVEGVAGEWLRETAALLRAITTLRHPHDHSPARHSEPLRDLPPFEQQRWLVRLIGASAAHFPALPARPDSVLAERLRELSRERDLGAVTFPDLEGASADFEVAQLDDVELSLRLAAGDATQAVLEAAQREVARLGCHPALVSMLASALRRRGDWAQALLLFDRLGDATARSEAAETCRRLGDRAAAQARLDELDEARLPAPALARARATRARLALDAGELPRAAELLRDAPALAPVLEVQALLALREQDAPRALQVAQVALGLAGDNEQAARAQSVVALAHHALGDAERALEAFQRSSQYAARAGAVVEEATYANNVAAAAADRGDLSGALEYGQRASLLFEHLERTRDLGRINLTLLCAHATVGAVAEARHWFDETLRRARAARDEQCQAYAHLTLADLLDPSAPDALEHARRAAALLASSGADDQLRAAARLLRLGEEQPLPRLDAQARDSKLAVTARLDWWGARARAAARDLAAVDSREVSTILTELTALASLTANAPSAGPNFSDAVRLARRAGEGDLTRRFASVASDALRQIERGTPAELRPGLHSLPWVRELTQPARTHLSREQIGHLENLVRALGTRDRLRPLLDQVLDALVLWTGVERGLVLLTAPGGRLVPRAARNLARNDLVGEQLRLSQSLAERALSGAEPVVAIDATTELSDLHQSVHALGLRSVLAVPLIARGEALGVVYLDDRTRRGAFGSAELGWVRLVGTLAALAIADARDQLLLRRAARRAQRAEARALHVLARREAQVELLQRELARNNDRGTRFAYDAIVGNSPSLQRMLRLVDRVAQSEIPVLILGESGSGKELVARAIHDSSARRAGPFVSENCAAIPEPLLESTLFGHVKGAFTGASRTHTGLFELAHNGTLFLDEVGEMSLPMQTKLLRAIETGEVRPVGSERTRQVDVRVLGATHRNLEQMVAEGTFRKDLFYRLNVIAIPVPPLRERSEDIDSLMAFFCQRHGSGRLLELTEQARQALYSYAWPGNIRELENETRRLLVMSDGRVDLEHLSPAIVATSSGGGVSHELDLRGRVDALESSLLMRALERTGGNQTRAAELLGVSRFGLQKMMKRLNIDPVRSGREPAAGLTDR